MNHDEPLLPKVLFQGRTFRIGCCCQQLIGYLVLILSSLQSMFKGTAGEPSREIEFSVMKTLSTQSSVAAGDLANFRGEMG